MKPNCIKCETNNQVFDIEKMSVFAKNVIDCNGIDKYYCSKCRMQFR